MLCYVTLLTVRELFYILVSICAIIFCFFPISDINKLKNYHIKTYFNTTQIFYEENKLMHLNTNNSFLNEDNNEIYINFFNKYNLIDGDKLFSSEKIESPLMNLYRLNIANIILFILCLIPSIIIFIFVISEGKDIIDSDDGDNGFFFFITTGIFILRFIIIVILFGI